MYQNLVPSDSNTHVWVYGTQISAYGEVSRTMYHNLVPSDGNTCVCVQGPHISAYGRGLPLRHPLSVLKINIQPQKHTHLFMHNIGRRDGMVKVQN